MASGSWGNAWGKRAAGIIAVILDSMLGCRARTGFAILVYHRVAAHVPGLTEPTLNVPPHRLRLQLAGLLRRGYTILPLTKVLGSRASGMILPPRTAVITFDDGFESVYTEAWPVLKELQVPATVFVSTAFLDSDEPFPFDPWGKKYRGQAPPETYRPLKTAQCHAMLNQGLVDLGSHTHTHADFRGRPEAFAADLAVSLEVLRSRFGRDGVPFAFPFGRPHLGFTGAEMMGMLRTSGVKCALSTEAVRVEPESDPFGWGRFNVYGWDDSASLAAKCNGWYSWAPRIQEAVTRLRRAYR